MEQAEWNRLSYAEKNRQLFFQQKKLLDTFLEHHAISKAYQWFHNQGVNCVLEWNEGNHFRDADIRTAKAFTWLLNQ